jgi:hypothetical protein
VFTFPRERVGATYRTLDGHHNAYKILIEKIEGKRHLVNVRVDEMIILK